MVVGITEYTIDAKKTSDVFQKCKLEIEDREVCVGYQTACHDNSKSKVRWVAYK